MANKKSFPNKHCIRWFYDRSIQLWTFTAHDADDNQIGQAEYAHKQHHPDYWAAMKQTSNKALNGADDWELINNN